MPSVYSTYAHYVSLPTSRVLYHENRIGPPRDSSLPQVDADGDDSMTCVALSRRRPAVLARIRAVVCGLGAVRTGFTLQFTNRDQRDRALPGRGVELIERRHVHVSGAYRLYVSVGRVVVGSGPRGSGVTGPGDNRALAGTIEQLDQRREYIAAAFGCMRHGDEYDHLGGGIRRIRCREQSSLDERRTDGALTVVEFGGFLTDKSLGQGAADHVVISVVVVGFDLGRLLGDPHRELPVGCRQKFGLQRYRACHMSTGLV